MANLDAPFGLRPLRTGLSSQRQNRYRIKKNYSTAIFQGDLVIVTTDGVINRAAASGTSLILGVFNGCTYTDPVTKKPVQSAYYPGGINVDGIMATVIDDPHAMFEIQSDEAFGIDDLMANYDIVATVGDTSSGVSRIELDASSGTTTTTLPLKAIDISQDPENNDVGSAHTNVVVMINNHLFSGGTTGLA